jgi:hypothetical protein
MESTDLDAVAARFRDVAPRSEFWSLRLVDERNEQLAVRRGVVQPPHVTYDSGAMITVREAGSERRYLRPPRRACSAPARRRSGRI